MDETPLATITPRNLVTWVFFGLPAVVFWTIGGLGALSLLSGLSAGDVRPGEGTSTAGLSAMWLVLVLCSIGGVTLGGAAFFRRIPLRWLVCNTVLSFVALSFSVLAD